MIIPTKNSEMTIEGCLESIKKQSYLNLETIVVDKFSKDRTKEIAAKFSAKIIESQAGMSHARNVGIEKAKGDLLLCIDSDMELTGGVVKECVQEIRSGHDAIVIPETSVGIGFWARCKILEKICYLDDEQVEASRFFKRDILMRLEGYDSELEFGEDKDLHLRLMMNGFQIGRIHACIIHNEGRLSLKKTFQRKYRYGKTLSLYAKKHPNEAKMQLRIIRPAFVRNWKLLVRDPLHGIGMMFMKACEFASIEIAYLTSWRGKK